MSHERRMSRSGLRHPDMYKKVVCCYSAVESTAVPPHVLVLPYMRCFSGFFAGMLLLPAQWSLW